MCFFLLNRFSYLRFCSIVCFFFVLIDYGSFYRRFFFYFKIICWFASYFVFRFVLLWFALNIFALTLAQFYTWNYTKGKTRRREKQFKNYIFFPFCRCNRSGTPIAVCSHYDGDVYVCLCFISLIFFHIFWKAKAKYAGVQLFVTIIIMIKKYFGYGVCIIHIQATYIELIFEAPFNAHEHIVYAFIVYFNFIYV